MNAIAPFEKLFNAEEMAMCVCGHARHLHLPRCCGMAACNKCKGFHADLTK